MRTSELKERIFNGEEFLFDFEGEEYWVSQSENYIYLTKVKGSITQKFNNVDELFNEGIINSRLFKEIVSELKF